MEVELPDLDVASALSLLGDEVDRIVLRALDGSGLRRSHGYLVQRLVVAPATATEMAVGLGVTQQAVSKAIKELEALGVVEPVPDTADRRSRPVRLTAFGWQAVTTARAARSAINERIRQAVGEQNFADTLTALRAALDVLELSDRVRRRAVAPPGPTFE